MFTQIFDCGLDRNLVLYIKTFGLVYCLKVNVVYIDLDLFIFDRHLIGVPIFQEGQLN